MKIKLLLLTGLLMIVCTVQATLNIGYVIESEAYPKDDDEEASCNWFKTKYPEGKIITCQEIAEGTVNLSDYQTLWIHIDRVGLSIGANNLPAAYTQTSVVNAIKTYYDNGGNLLLTNHATQYIVLIERTNRAPGIFSSGDGGTGTDNWTFNANIGYHPNEDRPYYNHEGHDIFKGLEFKTGMNPEQDWVHKSCGLIGSGFREDHNCMWDLNSYGFPALYPEKHDVVAAFEFENNAVVLGTWGHVVDYCCTGIIEFLPTNTSKGRCIAIGLAAYEWKQNDHANIFQENIERMTANIFSYLTPLTNSNTQTDAALQGVWNEDSFAGLNLDYAKLTSLDLTGVIGLKILPQMNRLNPNCLIYANEGFEPSDHKNVIIAGKAVNIELVDEHDFNIPSSFYTKRISYTRDFNNMNGWASVCFPFIAENLDEWTIEELTDIKTIENTDERVAVFHPVEHSTLRTNYPYIVKVENGTGSKTFVANDVELEISREQSINNNGIALWNNYRQIDGNGLYMLKQDGTCFVKGSFGATIGSFRSYLLNSQNKRLTIVHNNNESGATDITPEKMDVFFISTNYKGIEITTSKDLQVYLYTIDGVLTKVLNLNRGTTPIGNLNKGIYLINNHKVVIY